VGDVVIQVRVIKGRHFRKEMDISWPDGARTELTPVKGVLHGVDGKDYTVKRGDEHMKNCRKIMETQGYSFRRR